MNQINKDHISWMSVRVGEIYRYINPNSKSLEIFVVGSQSVWGKLNPPPKLLTFTEDIDFIISDYSEDMDNRLEYVLGSASPHSEEYNSSLDIVEDSTISAPLNWKDRTKSDTSYIGDLKVTTSYMDHHDLVFCKLMAGRQKDYVFVEEMFRCNLLSPNKLTKILRSEMDHLLNSPEDFKKLENKINHYIDNHLSPRTQVRAKREIDLDP